MSDNRMISNTNISNGGLSSVKEDRPAFLLVSLGCDKNLSDSEMMMGLLSQAGYRLTDDENEADVIVVNTCCFIMQIKKKLGISGILTNEYAWRCLPDESTGRRGVQIDLLIDRSDGIIDVCELKYSKDSYTITSEYAEELARKRNVFQSVTGTKKAIHSVMVTTDGLTQNEYWGDIQAEIQLDDLYEL